MYRVEFFTDKMTFASSCLISKKQAVSLDFLAFDAFSLTVPTMLCEKGYFVHIADGGQTIADGVVSDVSPNNGTQTVKVRPLQSLFDVTVPASTITDVISWISETITSVFVSNSDTLQNRPLVVSSSGSAGGLSVSGNTIKILDVIAAALTTYGVVVDCSLNMADLTVAVNVFQQTNTITLEADLPNVVDKKITLGDSYGAANKAYIQEVETVDGVTSVLSTAVFFLHPNGTVDQTDADRITPVFWVYKDVKTSDTWAADALGAAVGLLAPKEYDNEIVLTYALDDALVDPLSIPIGVRATIYVGGVAYTSIFSGREIVGGRAVLTFGEVRVALTKKMIIERRRGI